MNFDVVSNLRVLFVGDAIIDRYVFVKPLGKAMKESVISVGYEREEEYRGGIWAAAKHVDGLCKHVDVMHGPHVMINTRFVEFVQNRKLLSMHASKESDPSSPDVDIASYDCVVVVDFGHGTMTPELIERVSRDARFLAVNAQTNSTNFGFNLITKYHRADYVVLDKLEAQLAAQDNVRPIEDVILSLKSKRDYKRIIVTLGSEGAIGFDGEFYREMARTDIVVDTIGAGDAFLAVSSPFAAARYSMQDLVAIGNAAGAAKVGIVGHRRSVTTSDLKV